MAHRLAPEAEVELDEIWYYIAKESGSVEIADRLIDSISERFFLLARYPQSAGAATRTCDPGCEVFLLHVFAAARDIEPLL